jgi:hypothetical protein
MSPLKGIRITLIAALIVACAAAIGLSQEFRGSITGRVVDNNGAAVANAAVTITNTATNVLSSTTTNGDGDYTALYLIPGSYTVTVEATGFKKSTRQNVEIRVGDKLQIDLHLEVGNVSDTVNVTSESPLLETNTASAGQVVDQRRIQELPLSDGNPFVLSRLAAGVAYTGDLLFSRPFDNGGTSSIVADGSTGGSEFTLDGTPNMANGRRVAFVPPSEVVQEFKVQTASFDAQQGHTAGAVVNVSLKSGTNSLHGTGYEFLRNDKLSANDFFLNRQGKPRAPLRYNRYGGAIGGPVWLPKKLFGPAGYDGRNKTFWFFGYEGIRDNFPEPGFATVPTAAERGGDFSALLGKALTTTISADGNCAGPKGSTVTLTNRDGSPALSGQIYNPQTAQTVSRCNPLTGKVESHVERLPFAGNRVPGINPVAQAILNYYPTANTAASDSSGRNNFIGPNGRSDIFDSESTRIDHNITDKQHISGRFNRNFRREFRGNIFEDTGGVATTGNFLFRVNYGGSIDHVYTIDPTKVLNLRLGFSRFTERNQRPHAGFDPRTLGLSGAFIDRAAVEHFPAIGISGFTGVGGDFGNDTNHMIYSLLPVFTWTLGGHALRFGADLRSYRENRYDLGNAIGSLTFGNNFTKGPLDNSTGFFGQELAAFMIGNVTSGSINNNASRANQLLYYAGFFQDDWKVNSKLTLNLGLRYELEGAVNERYNRNVRGFDATAASPIEAAVQAALAKTPIAEAPSISVKGGLLFANDQNRGFYEADKNNVQPRIGFAYQLSEKTVIRGGYALYMVPFIFDGSISQSGFSQDTGLRATTDNGLTFLSTLSNPYPQGILPAPGASQGLLTFVGRSIGFANLDRVNPLSSRWEASFQRELPGGWLFEAAYVGSRGHSLSVGRSRQTTDQSTDGGVNLNYLPRNLLSTSPVRDDAVIGLLSKTVPNPFRGIAPAGTGLGDNSTVSLSTLLNIFPAFSDILTERFDGSSIYHSAQIRVEKRFSRGFTLLSTYTWSRYRERISLLNPTDTELEERVSGDDRPHRFVASGIWELPFGHGRHWGNGWGGFVNGFLGDWQAQGIYQLQSGAPITWGNIFFQGDPSKGFDLKVSSDRVDTTAYDLTPFYLPDSVARTNGQPFNDTRIRLANNIRIFPSRIDGVRGQRINLWDLSLIKNINLTESVKLQIRGEFLNAFNHPIFGFDSNNFVNPTRSDFGKITSQANLPRNVQIGLKLIF